MKKRASTRTKKRPSTRLEQRVSARGSAGTNATWSSNAAGSLWNTLANWSPATVPTDTAAFGPSSQKAITFAPGSRASVDRIEFGPGADAYTLTFTETSPIKPTLTIAGAGVSNASSSSQLFKVAAFAASRNTPQLAFTNSASAGGSSMRYSAGPTDPSGQGGGVIRFYDKSTAGAASFEVTTGSGTPPKENSTVGGEVTFSETASAGTARFTTYGTIGTDGDTFGNVVFHDNATAAEATFTNAGGTVATGDGGNTQFYDTATAGNGVFHNLGASIARGNGGDVAFDGTATAADGHFHNYPATAAGGYGGVTSFNNNCPQMPSDQGSSAGHGHFFTYGATAAGQYGGHVYFTAKYGSPTAANGTFINHGASVPGSASSAGRTVFSISLPQLPGVSYSPTAGSGVFLNLGGTAAGAPGGVTAFTVYTPEVTHLCSDAAPTAGAAATARGAKPARAAVPIGPNAGNATIVSFGAKTQGANGWQTTFGTLSGSQGAVCSAANAHLVAMGGSNGGNGGTIVFLPSSSGGSATIRLSGNGTLDVSKSGQTLAIAGMDLSGGIIACSLGTQTTDVVVTGNVNIWTPVTFNFVAGTGFEEGTAYTILTAPNLSGYAASQFSGNPVNQATPAFRIVGNSLQVTFDSTGASADRPPQSRSRTA
jgi:hypothetical protein